MAFVARVTWAQPASLDKAVTDCIREHSAERQDPKVLRSEGPGAAVAWVGPSRGQRFSGGLYVLLSGRAAVPRASSEEGELSAIHRLYRAHGSDFVDRIAGSFGIVIFDPAQRLCVFARDRIGFVPLFYRIDRDGVWVADTIKPILASRSVYFTLDHEAIYRYIYLKAFESPDTTVKEIRSVEPANCFSVNPDSTVSRRFWDIPVCTPDWQGGNRVDDLEGELSAAVIRGLGEDTGPIGVLVSGGLDSGVLSCMAAQRGGRERLGINVAFESKWSEIDESYYAQAVADACGLPLTKVEFTLDRLADSLGVLWWNNPLPTANSGFKLNLIGSQLGAGQRSGTFMLGEGADTLLSFGWNWKYFDRIHRIARFSEHLPDDFRQGAAGAAERFLQGVQSTRLQNDYLGVLRAYLAANLGYLKWKGSVIRPESIDRLFAPGLREQVGFRLLSRKFGAYLDNVPGGGFSEKLIHTALRSYVPNQQLMNYQTASNYFGAELACPFLDESVVEFCLNLPARDRNQKHILKDLAERWIPRDIVHREKCAFLMPMTEWINTGFRPLVDLAFSREVIERRGLFDYEEMHALRNAFDTGAFGSWPDIWTFVVLEAWMRINLDAPAPVCPDSIAAVFPELEEFRKTA
jgi:asparagine synthase (glutamine-hydrolysing)